MLAAVLSLLVAAPAGDLVDPWAVRGDRAAAPASELLDPWASAGRAEPGRASASDLKDPFRRPGGARSRGAGGEPRTSPELLDPFRGAPSPPRSRLPGGLRDPFAPRP